MSNPNKRKGSQFENDLTSYFRSLDLDAERLPQTGVEDEGDIVLRLATGIIVIEAKAEARMDLPGYLREAERERLNYASHRSLASSTVASLVVVKRRMSAISESYAITTLGKMFGEAE